MRPKKACISTPTFQQVQMEILLEKREDVGFENFTICAKAKLLHCKNSLGVAIIDRNVERPLRRFQGSFSWMLNVLIIHEFFTLGKVFERTRP